jgi:hypothetical protein
VLFPFLIALWQNKQILLTGFFIMLSFTCRQWHAWAPGVTGHEDWQTWAREPRRIADEGTAPATGIPAMLRRRAARLGRAACETMCGLSLTTNENPIIFCSRHGELSRSLTLLEQLADEGAVSPQEFGMAVHNAVAGLYSIAKKDHAPITALASENALVLSGLQESLAQLADGTIDSLMLVVCDEPVPTLFKPFIDEEPCCLAVACELSRGDDYTLAFSDAAAPAPDTSILSFIRFLAADAMSELTLSPHWSLRRNDVRH